MKKAIPQSVHLGFLCGLIIIIIAAALPYRNVQLLQSSERWADHTIEVLRAADALRIAVTDAESGQRGFLLTQNPAYLEPYNTARKNISQQLTYLATLTAGNPLQVRNLNNLKEHIVQKFDELEATVALQDQSRHTEALVLVATNRGNDLMQKIRNGLIDFESTERQSLDEHVADARTHFERTFYSFLLVTLLTFLLFSGLYFFIVRSFKERQAAELSLTQQSNLLTSVVNSMSEGLYVIDTSGKTLVHNPILAEIYGKEVAKFGPEDWQSQYNISSVDGSVFAQDDFPAVKVLKGAQQATAEMVMRAIDSSTPKIIRVSARPINNQAGTLDGVVCISSDISESKKGELRLRLATAQAEAANKAKSEFVANMSHEIRTPLNAILGTAQLLHNTEITKAQKKYLDMISMSGKSLLNILNDILDFSKIEAGKMELAPLQFRLNDVMQSLSTIMSMAALKQDIELVIDIKATTPPLLFGDSHRLHQILVNLVSNAIKFTEQGEVAVIVSGESVNDDRVMIRFTVKDTGIGMTQAQQDRLFSAFTQADTSVTRQFGGTGLGLIISRRLAEMMGGHIELSSSPGQGSEFSLVLPFTQRDDIERHVFIRHYLDTCSLLVIDNNESARNAIANHIAAWRWKADLVASQEEALELLRKAQSNNSKYDAILLDWEINGENGENSLNAIKSVLNEKIPIVLMVNMYARENISENILLDDKQNSISLLLKPIIPSNLFDALHEVLAPSEKNSNVIQKSDSNYQPLKNVCLLIVEDNEFNRIVARDLLEQVGAVVDVAENGQRAVDVLRTNAKIYDAILMDVQMPVMDGFTATKVIRDELKNTTPIIATTAGVTEFERESCLASGMNDLIAKPIELDKMVATIQLHTMAKERPLENRISNDVSSTQNTDGIFDITNMLKIGEKIPGYTQKLAGIIENLLNNTNASFASAKIALVEKNYKEVARILHTLRGSLGVIGAKKFSEHTLIFEKLASENTVVNDLETSFNKVATELTKTLAAAKKWVVENSNIIT